MTTTSIGVPDKWSDEQEFVNNGTIQSWFNGGWLSTFIRAGVLDLKAPDELYPGSHFLWNPTPTIPKRARIQAASLAGVASRTMTGVVDTALEVVSKDGRWDAGLLASHWAAGDPASSYPVHNEVHVFDGVTEIAATGAVAGTLDALWPTRRWGVVETPPTARGQKVGQVLTIATGGTLTSASIRASKEGAPGGNCWLEVYSVVGGLPSALLATSNTRLASSFSAPGYPDVLEVFTFSGINQITQTLGTQYAYVLTGDWPVNFTAYLQTRVLSNATLGTDKFPVIFGESRGLGWGNYVEGVAPLSLPVIAGSPSVAWAPPNFTAGIVYTSPDLSALAQAWVDAPSYVPGEPILVRWRPTNPAQLFERGFKSWVHADTPSPSQLATLTVEWKRRKRQVT